MTFFVTGKRFYVPGKICPCSRKGIFSKKPKFPFRRTVIFCLFLVKNGHFLIFDLPVVDRESHFFDRDFSFYRSAEPFWGGSTFSLSPHGNFSKKKGGFLGFSLKIPLLNRLISLSNPSFLTLIFLTVQVFPFAAPTH